jgi:DNA (cytosine-5)-methyltransferase 1
VEEDEPKGRKRFVGVGENGSDVSDSNSERLEGNVRERLQNDESGELALRDLSNSIGNGIAKGNREKEHSGKEGFELADFVIRASERNRGEIWKAEPDVGRVADGVPNRVDRIKCLGNSVVPQVAETIGGWILGWVASQNQEGV